MERLEGVRIDNLTGIESMGIDKREIARKGVHLLSIFYILIYLFFAYFFGHRYGLFALALLLILFIEFEYVRIELRKKVPLVSLLWWVKRPKEKEKLGAEVFFLIGSIICFATFDLGIAVAAILMTTFGDLASALVGRKFRRYRISYLKNKSWAGVIAEFIADIIVGFLVVRTVVSGSVWWLGSSLIGAPIWPIIISMSIVATVVETIIQKLDDNLLVPVFAGFTGQVVLILAAVFF